ncbi:hypothetical protein [Phormidium sp. CCY1219]|uniref:hypothetical protein n=1 Tax=Phormidium sp. CCY1219 TaxID=2886104 RepID=UPI002D1EDC51|nr:hypothetical protein [Phormidium sp. CCY1219]MEB3827800.1 hypothetical protein [Phormidium sp. CCY1219]
MSDPIVLENMNVLNRFCQGCHADTETVAACQYHEIDDRLPCEGWWIEDRLFPNRFRPAWETPKSPEDPLWTEILR